MPRVLLDTGPLVALLSGREARHSWVKSQFAHWAEPCVTCEPVLTEAFHLLAKVRGGSTALRAALHEGLIAIDFDLRAELAVVLDTLPGALVFTLDEDFRIYRKNRTELVEVIAPFS